jgi:hypothetical protein
MCPGSSPAGGVARQALFGSDYMYCLMIELPQLIDRHLLCEPKQQFAMASAEEKWKDESKDRQVMGSNANGAGGAEGNMEENIPSKVSMCVT